MATLKKHHKEYIIKQLAMFERPSDVIHEVREVYDIEVSTAQIAYYNPDNTQGKDLAEKWCHLFQETRDKFLEGSIQIPIAHKHYRLRELQKNYQSLLRRGQIVEANAVLEQAAKEMGDAYQANGALLSVEEGGTVNFLQQVNQKIEAKNNG